MEKIVRISTVAQHEEARREDVMKMTPNERVAMLMRLRDDYCGEACCPIAKVATIRRLGGK